MAAIDSHRASGHVPGRFLSAVAALVAAVVAWNNARVTRAALSQLTAHELDDIGLTRADLDRL